MVYQTFRDSFVGQILYFASGRKLLQFPEESPDFKLPEKYKPREKSSSEKKSRSSNANAEKSRPSERHNNGPTQEGDEAGERTAEDMQRDRERANVPKDGFRFSEARLRPELGERNSNSSDRTAVAGGGDDDEDNNMTEDGIDKRDIVTWYGPDDPENPQNWSLVKKCWVTFCIMLITVSVYMGSSIWSPGIQDGMAYFGVSQIVATLGISLFVVGYGTGPLFLSPLSEIPQVGRSIPYIVTLALFCILQVPTALVTNFAGFAILRFLAGFIGSPPLATGGASLQDVFSPHKLPYAMGLYGLAAASGPALAPIVASFAVEANGWRWCFWIMLWLSGGSLLILAFWLPETSANNILLRRAQRLRKLTGNSNLKSQSEIDSSKMTSGQIVKMTLVRPLTMTFTEPIVLAINLYVGLIYAILYSYFESFPIVYAEGYGFSLGVSTLPFASLLVGSVIAYFGYCLWNRYYFEPRFIKSKGKVAPEARLPMSMLGAFCFPICLFWFAWTSNRTHWISPVIAQSFFGIGTTWMFMPFLTYLPNAYPEYAASVLASNDFVRSMMGAGMPIAAVPFFKNLGISWANTLLGCLTVLFIPIPFALFKYGHKLRAISKTCLHDEDLEKMPTEGEDGEA